MKKLLRRFFGPSTSLIFAYDRMNASWEGEMQEQLDEAAKYYKFVKLSEIVSRLNAKDSQGLASVVFTHARKSLFLRALPVLRAREIPVTVFLDVDSIGLNRLPAEEELALYRESYPDKISESDYAAMLEKAWREPKEANALLRGYRQTVGPLPLDKIDPMLFFVTWGKILEIPPALFEAGLSVSSTPANAEHLGDSLDFIRHQLGRSVMLAHNPRAPEGEAELKRAGIEAVLTRREGVVDKKTSPMDLPYWNWSAVDETT